MPRPFTELSEEFNRTSKSFLEDSVPVELLLAKYSILMSHKADAPEQRKVLVQSLYECGVDWLKDIAGASKSVDYQMPAKMETLFARLTADDSIAFIPTTAPATLTDVALDLLRRGEAGKLGGSSQGYLIKLATQTLEVADKVRAAHEKLKVEIATTKDITASKRIEVRQKDDKFSL